LGLHDHKCDSCEDKVDVLFPIAILEKLPSGIEQMIQRYYCIDCASTIQEEAEEAEEEEKKPHPGFIHRVYSCTCEYEYLATEFWIEVVVCSLHRLEKVRTYNCGCVIKDTPYESQFIYLEVCEGHEQAK